MCLTNPVTANCCQQEPFSNTREVVKLCTKYWLAMILLHRLQHRRFHQKLSNNQNTKIHHLHFNSHFLPETGFSQITQFFFLHLFCNRTLEDTWHILTLFTAFPSPKQQRHKTSICFYFHDMKIENAEWSLVLLRWQEFAIRSVVVFLTCHRGGGAGGKYVSVSRLRLLIGNRWISLLQDRSGCPGMR